MEAARLADETDFDGIIELAVALRAELAPLRGGHVLVVHDASPVPTRKTLAELSQRNDARVVVGTVDEVVIAYGIVSLESMRDGGTLGVITELFVEAEGRGIGLGEAITNDLVSFCNSHRCMGVDAVALPGMRATKNFFEGEGFSARSLTMHHALEGPP